MTEKPLHVRVAEALGFKIRDDSVRGCTCRSVRSILEGGELPPFVAGEPHDHVIWSRWVKYEWENDGDWYTVPLYDVEWQATGPLIEKYGIALVNWDAPGPHAWNASYQTYTNFDGPTPLVAVCNLIVALGEAGKL